MFCLLPASLAFGQQIKKENLKGTSPTNPGTNYAVFYSTGMPGSAIWPLGMKLSNKDGRTIRHTSLKAIGSNINTNEKVPFRFIIAPTEQSAATWAAAMGFAASANSDLTPGGTPAAIGCANYSTTEFPGGWRLPTQREMMIMWLFREGIDAIYSTQMSGQYWSATEKEETTAWYLDFNATVPESKAASKTTSSYKYRCVRDY